MLKRLRGRPSVSGRAATFETLRSVVRCQVLPGAVIAFSADIIERWRLFALHQAVPHATLADHHQAKLGIDLALSIPVAAGSTHFYLGRQNQFSFHDRCGPVRVRNSPQSAILCGGSVDPCTPSMPIIRNRPSTASQQPAIVPAALRQSQRFRALGGLPAAASRPIARCFAALPAGLHIRKTS